MKVLPLFNSINKNKNNTNKIPRFRYKFYSTEHWEKLVLILKKAKQLKDCIPNVDFVTLIYKWTIHIFLNQNLCEKIFISLLFLHQDKKAKIFNMNCLTLKSNKISCNVSFLQNRQKQIQLLSNQKLQKPNLVIFIIQ